MRTILHTLVVVSAAALLAATSADICVGQTRDPGSILAPTLFDPIPQTLVTDNIDYTLPKVMIGWNWGAPPRQAAIDMRTNVHHFASPFKDALPTGPINETTFAHLRPYSNAATLVPGVKLIFDPSGPVPTTRYATEFTWFWNAYNQTASQADLQFSHSFPHSLIEGMGMRFQPELDLGTNPDQFVPRANDQQKAIFGFLSRSVGTSPTNTADPNFNRWVLRKDDLTAPTAPEVVLSDSWPDNEFAEWPVRFDEHQSAPFNGRRMYVAINLRRLAHSTDQSGTTDDAEPVLRLRINRLLCDNSNTWARLRFDSIPRADLTGNWVNLPTVLDNTAAGAARGRKLLLDAVATGPVDEIVITRHMLPHCNDADGSDITILAHFVVDGSPADTYWPDVMDDQSMRRNHLFLRPQNTHGQEDCGSVDPKHKYIRKLSIEVEYAGNADVAIDWIDLGTENYTYLMQGYFDREARAVAERELTFLDLLNDNRADLAANRARITRWFSRDEGTASRWQAMRHYHLLFDSRSQTELGTEYYPQRYTYMLEPDFIWEGKSGDVRAEIIAPYVRSGWKVPGVTVTEAMQRDHIGIAWGMNSSETIFDGVNWPIVPLDYDLRWGNRQDPTNPVGLPAELTSATKEAAAYPRVHASGYTFVDQGSLQQRYEISRWEISNNSAYLFDDSRPWVANSWLHSDWDTKGTNFTTPSLTPSKWRPLTGEETRLLLWSQIILGSKGIIAYWGTSVDSLVNAVNYDRVGVGGQGAKDIGLASGMPQPNDIRGEGNTTILANFIHALGASDTMLGTDYLYPPTTNWTVPNITPATPYWQPGMRLGIRQAFAAAYPTVVSNLGLNPSATPPHEIYIGQHSPRVVVSEIAQALHAHEDLIGDLRLKTWWSRGFRTWTKGDANVLATYLKTNEIASRHPERDDQYQWATWEPTDSSFVEVTFMAIDNVPAEQRHVIGVLNRRCNPHDYVADGPAPVDVLHIDPNQLFRSTASHYDRTRASTNKSIRYRQAGSRQIHVPFHSNDPDVVLRIRELGGPIDVDLAYRPIDTIVGASTGLNVLFLPGEGKLFEVTRMNAQSQEQVGHLAHSNQRKLVVFPQAHATANLPTLTTDPCFVSADDTLEGQTRGFFRMVQGTRARYHRVWHSTGDGPNGAPQVWYQRSNAVDIDPQSSASAAQTSLLTWDPPILVSQNVIVPPHEGTPEQVLVSPSSGYPAIVVRFNHEVGPSMQLPSESFYSNHNAERPRLSATPYARQSVAYVVYSAELGNPVNGVMPIGIIEAMLPADVPHAAQVAAIAAPANYPRVIARSQGQPYQGAKGSLPTLWAWGTPMINASAGGNWYCWSTNTQQGIGYGFKRPGQWGLASTGFVPPMGQSPALRSTHPTLNSYSRLHLGEHDAAMSWQEGTDAEAGWYILYTRLRLTAAGNVDYFLTNSVNPAPNLGPDVNVINGNRVYMSSGYGHLHAPESTLLYSLGYPTLFRNLSDYELGVDNTRFNLKLNNNKGDRLWWHATLTTGSQFMDVLMRKWIDVDNYSVRDANQQDVVRSSPQQYMTAGSIGSLVSPEISQGEQTTEMFSAGLNIVPNPTGPWWQDSVNYMTCTMVPGGGNAGNATALGFTYGWDLYAHGGNTQLGGPPSLRVTRQSPITGALYPHAAARFTNSQMPGYWWNRRIHQMPHVYALNYHNVAVNPPLFQWSAGFFKETPQYQYQIRGFDGFATDEWSLAVANVSVDGSKPLAYGSAASAVDAQASMFARKELKRTSVYASEPFLVDGYRQLDMRVHVIGDMPRGMLAVERLSDGQRFDVELRDPAAVVPRADEPLVPEVFDVSVALVEGKGSEYRLVLSTDAPTTLPTQHLELFTPATEDLRKGFEVRRVVNLATGGTSILEGGTMLRIQPQPATDVITIIVDAGEAARRSGTALTMNVVGAHGSAWHSQQVAASDFVRLDVSAWPAGVYAVTLASHKGVTSTARFVVVR